MAEQRATDYGQTEPEAAVSGQMRKEAVASLVGRWMKDAHFRRRVQQDLEGALVEYGYAGQDGELFPEELNAVRAFDRETLRRTPTPRTPEEVDDILIGTIPRPETGGVSHWGG